MKQLYLLLAIVGAIVPYIFFTQFFLGNEINLISFATALFNNGAAAGFTSDLLVTSSVFWIYMFQQHRHSRGPKPNLFIILNLTVGLSCALPAYLYTREK